ncbi:BTB/POZ domain-containing protein [Parasponia andersonii]|uniref:BTB/POZ domain-containing protein n=1 Tax=Parasponia andersonii TaxID=3476 RepID=A0A2P5AHQ0_PARAD|nr:BTB/POZ domain-containing protein [Parasponia andersonii]
MDGSSRRDSLVRRRSWCCSFAVPPSSPDSISAVHHSKPIRRTKTDPVSKPISNSVPNSPQSAKSGLGLVGRIDPRRILSPGRVSPIDSDPTVDSVQEMGADLSAAADSAPPAVRSQSFRAPSERFRSQPESSSGSGRNVFDVRLNLRGKKGGFLVLELNSGVLCANSEVFAGLMDDCRKGALSRGSSGSKICRIEVPEVENLAMFRETIELMFEDDITKRLLRIGVYRAIDVLEVSAGIMFSKGVLSCLKYLEAVPWTEEEEEKLRDLFTRFKFDDVTTKDILARLYLLDSADSQQNLSRQLVWSITSSTDANARNELKMLVKGLLCKSSVYEKDHPDLNKEDIYAICQSCLDSLVSLFEETSGTVSPKRLVKDAGKPLIERISRQVDNINWLLDILIDRQMAEEFVDMWANQGDLLRLHENASPMVRYELSRVSAILFIAMGTRKLHCRTESRSGLLLAWFGPMLLDFGWLQRCRKGLSMKALEEAMGQALLTLPLKQQYVLFMEWFRDFSKHGTESPNLSKAFQIWWRRSFLRGSETNAIESR